MDVIHHVAARVLHPLVAHFYLLTKYAAYLQLSLLSGLLHALALNPCILSLGLTVSSRTMSGLSRSLGHWYEE